MIYYTKIINLKTSFYEISKRFYVIKEGFWQSILSDTYTFGWITFAFWFNHIYIGSRLFSLLLFITFFVTTSQVFDRKTQKLEPIDFIDHIKQELEVE